MRRCRLCLYTRTGRDHQWRSCSMCCLIGMCRQANSKLTLRPDMGRDLKVHETLRLGHSTGREVRLCSKLYVLAVIDLHIAAARPLTQRKQAEAIR